MNKRKIHHEDQTISIGNQAAKKRKIEEDESFCSVTSGKKRKIEEEDNHNLVPRKKMKTTVSSFENNIYDYVKKRRDSLIYI